MKVKCINAKHLPNSKGGVSIGKGLIEGEFYNALKVVNSPNGNGKCYLIDGIGERLCERFEAVPFTNALTEKLANDFKEYEQLEVDTPKEHEQYN